MSEDIERLIGAHDAMLKEMKVQTAQLFKLVREVREHGCLRGEEIQRTINDAKSDVVAVDIRLKKVEYSIAKAILIGAVVLAGGNGLPKLAQVVIDMMGK